MALRWDCLSRGSGVSEHLAGPGRVQGAAAARRGGRVPPGSEPEHAFAGGGSPGGLIGADHAGGVLAAASIGMNQEVPVSWVSSVAMIGLS
jgi:hypothetical protein